MRPLQGSRNAARRSPFFLKDNNPRKPNRWLALPRDPRQGRASFCGNDPRAAHRSFGPPPSPKAKELWGDKWGIAYNGDLSRTQCHAHVHIGKLLEGIETENFIVVDGPAQIPVPKDGTGLWVHPGRGGKLHVHLNEQICETVLLR